LNKKLAVLMATMAISMSLPLYAEERPSTIQMAAAARLAKRMGALRGGIAPNERFVILTTEMILQRTQPKSIPVNRDNSLQNGFIPTKPRLPPIVWEMGPGFNQLDKKTTFAPAGDDRKYVLPSIPGMTTAESEPKKPGIGALEALQKQAGEIVGQIVPVPVTKFKLFAGKYQVSILVRH